MQELINTFHIDITLIVAQMVNFLIVFLVLWFFALKPLTKIMQERTQKIEKSLLDAEKIEETLARSEENYTKKLDEAKIESGKILEKANQEAKIQREDMINKAKKEVENITLKAKQIINDEKNKMINEARKEVAELVILSLEKVIGKEINLEIDKKVIDKTIKELKVN